MLKGDCGRAGLANGGAPESTIKDSFSLEDMRILQAKWGNARPGLWEKVEKWVTEGYEERASASPELTADGMPLSASDFDNSIKFAKYMRSFREKDLLSRCICNICGDVASEAQITDCNHVFCKDCIQRECDTWASQETDFAECPVCQRAFSGVKSFCDLEARMDAPTAEDSTDDAEAAQHIKVKGKGNGRRGTKGLPKLPSEVFLSAKALLVKNAISLWLTDHPQDKIVVFTQFRLMARVIGQICANEGWRFLYVSFLRFPTSDGVADQPKFTGDMNPNARYGAQKRFQDPKSEISVMIAGLKCGGQGLNLTAANRVISIDLWWNHSVELQAFGRVFRIGQHKETYFMRTAVSNTVDDRLLKMQTDKTEIVGSAMRDDGRRVESLTIKELASLFGYVETDEAGNIHVVAPDEVSDENNSEGVEASEDKAEGNPQDDEAAEENEEIGENEVEEEVEEVEENDE